ncbi:MAG: hypothetical protein CEN87_71 [Parcubacteria group bacterium Licking1014_1]|nr:MAG: hypothetical protein CEN87_71 [Parcubacteria group bacterium Licking1014_1]
MKNWLKGALLGIIFFLLIFAFLKFEIFYLLILFPLFFAIGSIIGNYFKSRKTNKINAWFKWGIGGLTLYLVLLLISIFIGGSNFLTYLLGVVCFLPLAATMTGLQIACMSTVFSSIFGVIIFTIIGIIVGLVVDLEKSEG